MLPQRTPFAVAFESCGIVQWAERIMLKIDSHC
jgi:hypothetical protein